MASNYPSSLDSFDTIASDKKTSDSVGGRTHRDMHNDLGDAIESVQTELGTNPSGSDATVAARLSAIEAGTNLATGAVTSAKIADGTITATQIAANAVGSSELADNAVDTAAIQDSAITSAKIADGTIVAADVAADTFAAFGTVGNMLTSNQAKPTTTGAWSVLSNVTETGAGAYSLTNAGVCSASSYITGLTAGETYTMLGTLAMVGRAASVGIIWRDGGGTSISTVLGNSIAAGTTGVSRVTAVAPAGTASARVFPIYSGSGAASGDTATTTNVSFHRGAAGVFSTPGLPVVGQSRIATNGAVDLSGTGSPEGVVTAAPGSTWLQTDATTDVKGWIRWIKATGTSSTGWVAGAEADTGLRAVTPDAGASTNHPGLSTIYIRRQGGRVSVSLKEASAAAAGTGLTAVYSLTVGFRKGEVNTVVTGACADANSGGPTTASCYLGAGSDVVYIYRQASTRHFASLSYPTADTWPSSLPGSAA